MKIDIKNRILAGLIGSYVEIPGIAINGFSQQKGLGSAILTYLVKSIFNIHRFPMHEDRHFTEKLFTNRYGKLQLEQFLNNELFLKQYDNIEDELKLIYKTTQDYLNINHKNQEAIKLYRSYNDKYAAVLLILKMNAEKNNQSTIKISADILDSFTDENSYYLHYSVRIILDVPKKNILYYTNIFNYGVKVEKGEYIVINNSKDGLIVIPIENIIKLEPNFNEYNYNLSKNLESPYYYFNFSINKAEDVDDIVIQKDINTKEERFICKILKLIC